ncbi:wax ester/triacylglycerol synthase domain-containing protein [Rhodococcus sp. ARC_M6]|uniref:wax ester/triacylglycerol synthase domain-containing protein n=1 Tax=Rhodococcus sp. ARC_M6 TaxID=2928852 RepID=UPI001FB2090F|nr:wax ester/triacylglycerol synthase domain-containing protein [Rhodococcus sp. ARC_M6]MCJ0906985.1 WS/DGAT domain-containing protein [Rhodococcus sp. ARC_M6]
MADNNPFVPPSAVDVDLSAVAWGANRTMSDFETGMWRMEEAQPQLRSPIVAVEVLDHAPDWDRLTEALEWASHIVPRIRMRAVEPALQLGNPVWSVDPEFDIGYHLRRVRLPAPADFDHALRMCRHLATEPFDKARPPWSALLIEGLDDGRAVFVVKTHHSITDGMGGIQMMTLLHSRRRDHTPDKPDRTPPPAERLSSFGAFGEEVAGDIRRAPSRVAKLVRGAASVAATAITQPIDTATEVLGYANSLRRIVTPPARSGSPLLRERGLGRWFGTLEVGVPELKAGAKAAGGSLNDAYVAALLGGFRRYHDAFGQSVNSIPMGMPVSMRSGSDPSGGNRFAAVRFSGPISETDPAKRIRQVREIVLNLREEPALDALDVAAPILARLPNQLLASWYLSQSTGLDLQASNVAGVPVPVYLAGAKIERMFPFGPAPGCAVMATLVSHVGVCCIGINLDTAAVTKPALFMECVQESLDEIVALGTVTEGV